MLVVMLVLVYVFRCISSGLREQSETEHEPPHIHGELYTMESLATPLPSGHAQALQASKSVARGMQHRSLNRSKAMSLFLLTLSPSSGFVPTGPGRRTISPTSKRSASRFQKDPGHVHGKHDDLCADLQALQPGRDVARCSQSGPLASADQSMTLFDLPWDDVGKPLALLLFAQFLLFIGVGAVIPTIALYGKAIGLSSAANGVVLSTPAVASTLLARFSGGYADKGRKAPMMIGMAIIAISDVGTALASSLGPLVLARLGLGTGRSLSECAERGFLADLASRAPSLRGEIIASQQAICAFGIAIGAPLGGLAVESYGPRAAFLCVSAGATLALALYALLPETVQPEAEPVTKTATSAGAKSTTSSTAEDGKEGWLELLQDERWRGLAICEAGARFGYAAKIVSVPVIAAAILPGGAVAAGSLTSVAGLTALAGAPVGGWLSDQRSARFTSIASGIVCGISLILVPFALGQDAQAAFGQDATGFAFTALILLWSFAVAAQGPALTAVGQEMAPKNAEATALAFPRAVSDVTNIIAPLLLGLVADLSPGLGFECGFAGAASVISSLALAAVVMNKA